MNGVCRETYLAHAGSCLAEAKRELAVPGRSGEALPGEQTAKDWGGSVRPTWALYPALLANRDDGEVLGGKAAESERSRLISPPTTSTSSPSSSASSSLCTILNVRAFILALFAVVGLW